MATLVALAAACAPANPSPPPAGTGPGWPMYRGDLVRDGHPPSATLDMAAAARLRLAWSANLGGPVDGTPAVASGAVYAGSEAGRLAAFSTKDGRQLWEADGLGSITDSPAVAGTLVIVGSLDGRVRAFAASSGRLRWTWQAPGTKPAIWSSPTVWNGEVLVATASQYGDEPLEGGRLAAVDLADGKQRWVRCLRPACATGDGVWSTPAIDSAGRAFVGVGNPDDGVLAFDARTGRRLWQRDLYADRDLDLDVGATPVVITNAGAESVAVGSDAGLFVDLEASTGAVRWSRSLVQGSAVHGLVGSPASASGRLLVPSASPPTGLYAMDADGEPAWMAPTDLPIYGSPAVGDGVLVIGTGAVFGDRTQGKVLALSASTGAVVWTYDAHAAVVSSAAIAGSAVFIGVTDGSLLCFEPPGSSGQ